MSKLKKICPFVAFFDPMSFYPLSFYPLSRFCTFVVWPSVVWPCVVWPFVGPSYIQYSISLLFWSLFETLMDQLSLNHSETYFAVTNEADYFLENAPYITTKIWHKYSVICMKPLKIPSFTCSTIHSTTTYLSSIL